MVYSSGPGAREPIPSVLGRGDPFARPAVVGIPISIRTPGAVPTGFAGGVGTREKNKLFSSLPLDK